MPKVSVIVPVYKVEKYIEKCLISLVEQTLEDIEIIIVNDGSPDNSEKIILEYQAKYSSKIKYLMKENGGLSDARNFRYSSCNWRVYCIFGFRRLRRKKHVRAFVRKS